MYVDDFMTYQYLIRLYIDFKLITVSSEVWDVIELEKHFWRRLIYKANESAGSLISKSPCYPSFLHNFHKHKFYAISKGFHSSSNPCYMKQ